MKFSAIESSSWHSQISFGWLFGSLKLQNIKINQTAQRSLLFCVFNCTKGYPSSMDGHLSYCSIKACLKITWIHISSKFKIDVSDERTCMYKSHPFTLNYFRVSDVKRLFYPSLCRNKCPPLL